jgi:hypothetical protein
MRRSGRCSWGIVLLLLLALPASANAASRTRASLRLSDARTFAHWAHPDHEAPVRRLPSGAARTVARIHFLTEDGFPEVYPVLRRFTAHGGRTWLRIRIPMRPNGHTGWVRRSALGPLYRVHTRLVVNRRRLHATLYRDGRRIWRSPVGIGKASTPTPTGRFWIREKFRVYSGGLYGPRAFGTSDYSRLSDWPGGGVIGIHGTNEPYLIPGRPSHGCIRVPNHAIRRLYRLMPVGTPLWVLRRARPHKSGAISSD